MDEPRAILSRRLEGRPRGLLDIRSGLQHFALITYAVTPERLEPHLPFDRFEPFVVEIEGQTKALLSAVPFVDKDFFFRSLPLFRFNFAQTNHRVYVIDKETGEHAVWFFGTTLGSPVVHIPRILWKIPWYPARYDVQCDYDREQARYTRYSYDIRSPWCSAQIDLEDLGSPPDLVGGFSSMDEMVLVLTHPVDGYFYRFDGRVGTYSVSHDLIRLTRGRARNLYFELYERLGVLSAEEMQTPHSVLISPMTRFDIHMPPHLV